MGTFSMCSRNSQKKCFTFSSWSVVKTFWSLVSCSILRPLSHGSFSTAATRLRIVRCVCYFIQFIHSFMPACVRLSLGSCCTHFGLPLMLFAGFARSRQGFLNFADFRVRWLELELLNLRVWEALTNCNKSHQRRSLCRRFFWNFSARRPGSAQQSFAGEIPLGLQLMFALEMLFLMTRQQSLRADFRST